MHLAIVYINMGPMLGSEISNGMNIIYYNNDIVDEIAIYQYSNIKLQVLLCLPNNYHDSETTLMKQYS